VAIDGVLYGPVEATIDRVQGGNVWLTVGIREGKNREVKKLLAYLGLAVNRLIRISFGPFQLGALGRGEVNEIRRKFLREQLGARLAREANIDWDEQPANVAKRPEPKPTRRPPRPHRPARADRRR